MELRLIERVDNVGGRSRVGRDLGGWEDVGRKGAEGRLITFGGAGHSNSTKALGVVLWWWWWWWWRRSVGYLVPLGRRIGVP